MERGNRLADAFTPSVPGSEWSSPYAGYILNNSAPSRVPPVLPEWGDGYREAPELSLRYREICKALMGRVPPHPLARATRGRCEPGASRGGKISPEPPEERLCLW
ncbi:hypothetical protein Aph01nite_14910 [Acrocarpospora phusangensis]|uniref:Uncharacterized protein n=1 Tax=Acrocarpospora phusangensis TaxID=1070424 RepID=A0A919Q7X0_9ACTN|nr:hypothetical protein Aph01nite_14910 [Acrocarpospora phusangensis]